MESINKNMDIEIIPELIEQIAKEFNEHLEIPNNNKILFSGKFGNGKSTFLQEFFKADSIYQNSYLSVHISPVCYSVSSNEDIFSYLKYDILTELLKQNLELETRDFTELDVLPSFLKEKWDELIKLGLTNELLEYIPKIGKPIKLITEILIKGSEKIKSYKDELNSQSEDNIINSFMSSLQENNTIYENDSVTKIIEKLIDEQRKIKNKNIVLVIDDLDRIDAEHIFRMLNVFSSQLDNYERFGKMNKFGFEKVILVCDINNIQSIYEHKFGFRADFIGYIDKLFSKKIFEFNNYSAIYNVIDKQIAETILHLGYGKQTYGMKLKWNIGIGFKQLISLLIFHNLVSYRDFHKFKGYNFRFPSNLKLQDVEFNLENHIFYIEFNLLKQILVNYENVLSAVTRLKMLNTSIVMDDRYIANIVYILTFNKHSFAHIGNGYSHRLKNKTFAFDKTNISNYPDFKSLVVIADSNPHPVKASFEDYCDLLSELIKMVQINGF